LKFYSSVRIDLRRTETIKEGTEAVGNHVRARVVKNKVAPPFRSAEFDIMFSRGISREGNLIDLGVELGLVKKAGAFFSYGDIRLGQGRENAKQYLGQNLELAQEIEQKVRASAVTTRITVSEN
jgi:recombination protein RecA